MCVLSVWAPIAISVCGCVYVCPGCQGHRETVCTNLASTALSPVTGLPDAPMPSVKKPNCRGRGDPG